MSSYSILKLHMASEIQEDLRRSKEALQSAERNLKEGDFLTAANRAFVACENSVYVLLKSKFGSTSISRMKILTRLKEINPKAKETYDMSYDMRVQADYGRKAVILPINKENVENILSQVKEVVKLAEQMAADKGEKRDVKA